MSLLNKSLLPGVNSKLTAVGSELSVISFKILVKFCYYDSLFFPGFYIHSNTSQKHK